MNCPVNTRFLRLLYQDNRKRNSAIWGIILTRHIADADVTYAKLLSTIFSGQLLSQSNSGNAGGTMHYINLGGLKILWGTTGSLTSSNGTNYIVNFPTSFFTATPHYASANLQSMTGTADQTAGINANNALSTTSASITVANGSNTSIGGQQYSFLFIGV